MVSEGEKKDEILPTIIAMLLHAHKKTYLKIWYIYENKKLTSGLILCK